MERLVQFVLTQRLLVLMVFAGALVAGIRAWQGLPIDAFPDISPTQVKIIIKASGMTAEEIEAQITQPIETELLGIPRQAVLRSTTKYAITSITLDFLPGTDIYWARQQVSSRLASIQANLPAIAEGGLAPMSTPLSEILMFTVENPALTLQQKKHLLDWYIRPALRTVAGVADINVLGGYTQTFQFTPDPLRLSALGLSIDDIEQVILANHLNGSVGRMSTGVDTLVIRTQGRIGELNDMRQMVIRHDAGGVVRLADLGDVTLGTLTRYGGVTRNGEETTQALVVALKNANTANLVAAIEEKLAVLTPSLPAGTELNLFYNRKTLIDTAVATISSAMFQAVVVVVLVLALFLGELRASVVVATIIPVAVLLSFIAMQYAGITANLMSLGGMVIAIGMLVDAAVVVVENIVIQLQRSPNLPRLHVIYRASTSVATPVIAGTLIVIVVFLPLLTLSGLEGALFSPVAKTIVFAMLASLLSAFTIIPVLASWLLSNKVAPLPRYLTLLQEGFAALLQKAMQHKSWVYGAALSALAGSIGLFGLIDKTFMPTMDEGDIIVQLEKSPAISLTSSLALDKQIQTHLLATVPEIKQIVARTGSDELGLDPMSLNQTDVFMQLAPHEQWRFADKATLIEHIRAELTHFPGINMGFTQPIQMRVSEMLTGTTGMLAIKVFGMDTATLTDTAAAIAQVVERIDGAVDTKVTLSDGGEYLNVRPDPLIASHYGLTVEALSRYLRIQMTGVKVGEVLQGHVRTPLMFSSQRDGNSPALSVETLSQMPVVMPNGEQIPLNQVATVERLVGPAVIERENANRFAVVTTNVEKRGLSAFVADVRDAVAQQVSLPPGYTLDYGGEFENQVRATENLLMVIPVVMAIIFFILFSIFRSLALCLLVVATVPFALVGGVFALYVSGEYLSVPASVGFIALLGVAVLNAVVMISHYEGMKFQRMSLEQRIVEGARDRLRPILMTATTAMLGLIPLAMATGPGAEIQRPLAIVVIGGLVSATFITLFVLPLSYAWLEQRHAA